MSMFPGSVRQLTDSVDAVDIIINDASGNPITTLSGNPPSTATHTTPAVTTVDSTALAANASRKKFIITNPAGGKNVFLMYGAAASPTSYTVELTPGSTWADTFTGAIHAVTNSGTSTLQVTDLT